MEISRFFLATFSRANGNFSDFLLNESVFRYFVATCSRANENLTQNACTKNEHGIPFVREPTVQDAPCPADIITDPPVPTQLDNTASECSRANGIFVNGLNN